MDQKVKLRLSDINPLQVEYLPVSKKITAYESIDASPSDVVVDENNWFSVVLSDLASLSLKGGLAYFSGGFYLLKYTKTFTALTIDLKNGNFSSIFKRTFKNISFTPKIKLIQSLIAEKQDDQALSLLDEVLVELETIDDFEIRSSLNILRAKLHQKNNRPLAAAIYYMEAATLTSTQKLQKLGEGREQSLVNKTGMLYLLSLQSLALYLKNQDVDDNFHYWMSDLAKRAKTLLEKEALYRDTDKYHATKGEISLGIVNLPYPIFYIDNKSAHLNRKLALEVEKVKNLIEKRDIVRNLEQYLKEKKYLEDDLDFLLEVSSQVLTSESVFLKESLEFLNHLEKAMSNSPEYRDSLSFVDLLKIQVKLKNEKASENDIMILFKLLDKEATNENQFLHLLSIADKISTQLDSEVRKDFASLILEKNYPYLSEEHKACYKKISEPGFIAHDPEINCLYPENVDQFRQNLEKLEVKNHTIIHRGKVEVLEHDKFKEVLARRTQALFPNESLKDFGYLLNKDKQLPANEADNLSGLTTNLIHDLHLEESLKGVKDRIKNERARIGVFGLTKVGKSTFLNTLIGKEILKSDRGVATNIQTIIRKGLIEKATVSFLNGKKEVIAIDDIGLFTSEQGNPQNNKQVLQVEVILNCNLHQGIELVDIPGFGVNESNFNQHQNIVETCLGLVDGVFLITTPRDGLKSFELEFIKLATQTKKLPFVLVANKMDELDEDETLDLKEGLVEKLSKNDIKLDGFPTFFISSQMGLAFIEGTDKNRYFGMPSEEAKNQSGIIGVRDSLREVGEKVLSLKEKSIINILTSETETHKHDMIELLNDTELVQRSSKEETQKTFGQLQQQLVDLKQNVEGEFAKYQDLLSRVDKLDIDFMVSRIAGKVDFSKLTNKQEDFKIAEPFCLEVFNEEIGSVLKLMSEPLENALSKINKLSAKNDYRLPLSAVTTIATDENHSEESRTQRLGYLLEKIFSKHQTILSECKKVLTAIKSKELFIRRKQFQDVEKKYLHLTNHLDDRIKNIETATSYNNKEFIEKKDYFMKQIEISNSYLELLSRMKGHQHEA